MARPCLLFPTVSATFTALCCREGERVKGGQQRVFLDSEALPSEDDTVPEPHTPLRVDW